MSLRHFLVTTAPIPRKRLFRYKDIIEGIKPDDMLYSGKVSFNDLNDAEDEAVGDTFQQMYVYAIRSDFGLNYRVSYRRDISESFARNAIRELRWFKSYISSLMDGVNLVMVIALWVGSENNYSRIKTRRVDIRDWTLCEDADFEFQYGIVHQFVNDGLYCACGKERPSIDKF